jgi:hypothetical protein
MTLREIIDGINIFTDENFSDIQLLTLANRCISRINTNCSTHFPDYTAVTAEYEAFPADWQRDLVGNYVAYGIKMNDTSRSEASDYLEEFYRILGEFKQNLGKLVSAEIISVDMIDIDGFGGAYGIDTSDAVGKDFFSSRSNAGSM